VHVASASDVRYLPHAATLIESIVGSTPAAEVTFYLLHDGSIDAASCERLRETARGQELTLNLIEPPASLELSLPEPVRETRYPRVIWYRIWLTELFPELDRILYLDPDTLVVQDLRSLWSTDLDGRMLGAVRASPPPRDAYQRSTYERIVADGYFNSGVLLLDLRRMREQQFSRRLIETCHTLGAEPLYPDQDVLNLAAGGFWLPLHPKWNVFTSRYLSNASTADTAASLAVSEAVASPAVVHFDGPEVFKPWHIRCVHPHRELYRAYRARTPWPLTSPESAGGKDRILRLLPVGAQLALSRIKHRVTRWLPRQGPRRGHNRRR
jgi:lipopolysaccharide biosynthesis glycosyltransferase